MSGKGGKPSDPKKQKTPPPTDNDVKMESGDAMLDIPAMISNKEFDLDSYVERFQGITKVRRLMFIAERCPDLQIIAFRKALDEVKNTLNTQLYTDCVARARELLGDKLGDEWGLDNKWKGAQERKAQDTIVRLDAGLVSSRRDEGREPVRKAYLAIAQFYMERGDYSQAMTKYLEAKEASSTNAHHLQSCLDIIKCSVHTGTFNHVKNQAQRAQTIPDIKNDFAAQALVNATLGLYNLKTVNYRGAAQNFLSVTDHIAKHNDILSIQDVAVYASMTALASYQRRELKQVVSTDSFKRLVEHSPIWKKIISDFHANNYSAVFATLDVLKSDLYLDMYLASHVDKLISKIRDKALMEYFKPFVSVRIPQMAESFKLPLADLERQLVALIADGKISARIDSANKILYARHADERNGTFEKALAVGDKYIRDAKSMLLRLSLAENDFVVRHPEVERRIKQKILDIKGGDSMMKDMSMMS